MMNNYIVQKFDSLPKQEKDLSGFAPDLMLGGDSFQGVGIEGFCCIRCPYFMGLE